jgi:CBS domain-containing protein
MTSRKNDNSSNNNKSSSVKEKDVALVGGYMSSKIVTMSSNNSVLDVAKVMAERNISSIAITSGSKGKITGVLTERDIVKAVSKGIPVNGITAGSMMSSLPISIGKNSPVEDAAQLMVQKKVRHLLVKEEEDIASSRQQQQYDDTVGIITVTDIARYLKHKVAANTTKLQEQEVYSNDRYVELLRSEVWELFF